jgi:GT2 family glycosyltransferase
VIDVVVPVYRGAQATRRCLASVLASAQREPFNVLVVDDATPETDIAAHVDALAATGRVELLRNQTNQGFARSVNRAMALHPDRDVVLLNSDTEVANDWLDRLARCARGGERIGTATPFSNNATICSYPFDGWAGGMPGTLGLAVLDRLFATVNAARCENLPTAVGFCMYVRRDCLADVGPFDAERFGRGYGEENDFSMRAARRGWRNVVAADVFVFHEGAVSFSASRAALTRDASAALDAVHPDYLTLVREFVLQDPLASLRDAVDRARLACGEDEARRLLDERAAERASMLARWREAVREGEAVAQLRAALAHAEALVAERDAEIGKLAAGLAHAESVVAELAAELPKLRAGLAHAEALAFERGRRLEKIERSTMWKYVKVLLRTNGS